MCYLSGMCRGWGHLRRRMCARKRWSWYSARFLRALCLCSSFRSHRPYYYYRVQSRLHWVFCLQHFSLDLWDASLQLARCPNSLTRDLCCLSSFFAVCVATRRDHSCSCSHSQSTAATCRNEFSGHSTTIFKWEKRQQHSEDDVRINTRYNHKMWDACVTGRRGNATWKKNVYKERQFVRFCTIREQQSLSSRWNKRKSRGSSIRRLSVSNCVKYSPSYTWRRRYLSTSAAGATGRCSSDKHRGHRVTEGHNVAFRGKG